MHIVDVSNPEAPLEVGIWETNGLIYDVALYDDYAYVADPMLGLHVVDVSDPANPTQVNVLNTMYSTTVAIHDNHLYLYSGLLRIFDLTDPEAPVLAGTYDLPENEIVSDIAFVGNFAYTVGGSWLRVLDISMPASIVEVGSLELSDYSVALALSGTRAYVSEGYDDLGIADISDPAEPTLLSVFDIDDINSAGIMDLAAAGDFVFVSNKSRGLEVYNVSNPMNVQLVGFYRASWEPSEVVANENIVYLNKQFGIEIYDVSTALPTDNTDFTGPEQFYLSPVYPNPFNNTTRITFGSPHESYGRVVVYDMLGREMVTLYDGRLINETYQVTFDARNLSSGTYFVRFETPDFNAIQKAVLLK